MNNGVKEFTSWDVFAVEPEEDDPVLNSHKIDVAWTSGEFGGLSLYIDDQLASSVEGNSSASQLEEVLLGPSLGVDAGASGSMYFDEFTSSRLNGVSLMYLLPDIMR